MCCIKEYAMYTILLHFIYDVKLLFRLHTYMYKTLYTVLTLLVSSNNNPTSFTHDAKKIVSIISIASLPAVAYDSLQTIV